MTLDDLAACEGHLRLMVAGHGQVVAVAHAAILEGERVLVLYVEEEEDPVDAIQSPDPNLDRPLSAVRSVAGDDT